MPNAFLRGFSRAAQQHGLSKEAILGLSHHEKLQKLMSNYHTNHDNGEYYKIMYHSAKLDQKGKLDKTLDKITPHVPLEAHEWLNSVRLRAGGKDL